MSDTFKRYYEEELNFLREMGPEFARAHPTASQFLAERGSDPDVERLLEGFSFLVGRLRQKLDDEFPELTQSLMQLLSPQYLRSIPAMSIVQFEAIEHVVKERQSVARGVEVMSVPVDGTPCSFRTCYDVDLVPIVLSGVVVDELEEGGSTLQLSFRVNKSASNADFGTRPLRLFLDGDSSTRHALHMHLTRNVRRTTVSSGGGRWVRTLPADSISAVGFAESEAVLPYPPEAAPVYRYLQEYLAFPEKFLFVDIGNLPSLGGVGAGESFEVRFEFAEPVLATLRVSSDNFRLHCTPVINLFEAESTPIRVGHERHEYLLRPEGVRAHQEVFSVNRVRGFMRGSGQERDYPSFYSFRQERPLASRAEVPPDETPVLHVTRVRSSFVDQGLDTAISFVGAGQMAATPPTETVIADLTCTNRGLPTKLGIGDICRPSSSSPVFATFRNLTPLTASVLPPLDGELSWRLISNLYLNQRGLASVEALRGLLEVYDFHSLVDRQAARRNQLRMESLTEVRLASDEMPYKGQVVRGTRVLLYLKRENFSGEGEMILFANILNEFLALSCSLNSFVRLVVKGVEQKETYEWQPRFGERVLI